MALKVYNTIIAINHILTIYKAHPHSSYSLTLTVGEQETAIVSMFIHDRLAADGHEMQHIL